MYGILFGSQMHWIVAEYLVIFFLFPMNVTKKFVVDMFPENNSHSFLQKHQFLVSFAYSASINALNLGVVFVIFQRQLLPIFFSSQTRAPRLLQSICSSVGDLYLYKLSDVLFGGCVAKWAVSFLFILFTVYLIFIFWRGGICNFAHESSGW